MLEEEIILAGTLLVHQQIVNVVSNSGPLANGTHDFIFILDSATFHHRSLWPSMHLVLSAHAVHSK
jgi:hypothetical protein